ncbi:hypothetical protein [Ensifer sp.]|jgi:hypothetical protein|uniref:hypothetical protein n=1 Tax=Ensifer sp. TaxID=1872086 RepID=UPI002E0D1625|nr:hypothetical protein [Ensifer sp.]
MNGRVVSLSLVLMTAGPAVANESVYIDIGRDKCKTIAEEEGMYSLMTCPGHGDYPVRFKEVDIRQSVSFGHINQRYADDAFESFIPFNHAGATVEWRIDKDDRPVATILRWFIENTDASGASVPALQGQVLVVSRVAQKADGKGCVAGYVDALANPDPNALARKVADEVAPTFRCGVDKPGYHGVRGDKAAEPNNELPE